MAKQIVFTTFVLVTVAIVALVMFTHNANAQADAAAADSPMVDFKVLGGFIIEGVVFSIVWVNNSDGRLQGFRRSKHRTT